MKYGYRGSIAFYFLLHNKTTQWRENPVHHRTGTHVTQMIETRDTPGETIPEVDSEDVTTETEEGMDRANMWIMVGVIETRIGHLIETEHMVGKVTDVQNITNERETGNETETGKDTGMAQEAEIVQALLVALHHLPGLHVLGQPGHTRGHALAQGLLLLWISRSRTSHRPAFLQPLPTP